MPRGSLYPVQISPVTQSVLQEAFTSYASATPSLLAVVRDVVHKHFGDEELGASIWHDHFAFRTFGVPGLGIRSLSEPLKQLGYEQQQDSFTFPTKKLQATWFAPKDKGLYQHGLPRIFVSELEVPKLSQNAQAIIRRYTSHVRDLPPAAAIAALLTQTLPWPTPSLDDYHALLKESEYAAWTLAHGYTLNHSTISVHRLPDPRSGGPPMGVAEFTNLVASAGLKLNQEGSLIKVSPDGLLLQSSTVSDKVRYTFSGGAMEDIAGSYVEFAERRPLTGGIDHYALEVQRRDGFEVGNADKIFMSTSVKR